MASLGDTAGPSFRPSTVSSALDEYLKAATAAESKDLGTVRFESILLQCADLETTPEKRSALARKIASDLASDGNEWDDEDRLSAIKVLKELSRLSGSSEALATPEIIETVVLLARKETSYTESSLRDAPHSPAADTTSKGAQRLDLLLRVLNNVLLQHSQSRPIFASSTTGGFNMALELVERSTSATVIFLAARLIFFSTLYEADVTKEAVESWSLVDIFSRRTEELIQGTITPAVDIALAELQKAFFNVGLYYPRLAKNATQGKAIVGENFHKSLLPFLLPTLQLVTSHPSRKIAPPLTNAIAVLLNFPVAPYQSIWSGLALEEPIPVFKNSSTSKAKRMATSIFGRSSPTTSPSSTSSGALGTTSFLSVLIELLNDFLSKYFTRLDTDDAEASLLAQADGIDLQDYAEPALLLCRRLVDEVVDFRRTVKRRILPSDVDRSYGLDKRKDLTGILIRLMSSSEYPRLSRASGEVLLALCDGQAAKMTAEIGYGPCAGFLSQIGQLNSLPSAPLDDSFGQAIDPITGRVLPSVEEMAREDEANGMAMTEEEKEAEAERLFGLFDRLDRNGIIKVTNPVKQAVDSGKIRELEEKEEEEEKRRIEQEEADTETTVEREMKAFRLQQKRVVKDQPGNTTADGSSSKP